MIAWMDDRKPLGIAAGAIWGSALRMRVPETTTVITHPIASVPGHSVGIRVKGSRRYLQISLRDCSSLPWRNKSLQARQHATQSSLLKLPTSANAPPLQHSKWPAFSALLPLYAIRSPRIGELGEESRRWWWRSCWSPAGSRVLASPPSSCSGAPS